MMVKLEDASAPACSTVFYLQNDCHDTMQQVCMTLNQRAEQFLVFFFSCSGVHSVHHTQEATINHFHPQNGFNCEEVSLRSAS